MSKIISRPSTPEFRKGFDSINWKKKVFHKCPKCHGAGKERGDYHMNCEDCALLGHDWILAREGITEFYPYSSHARRTNLDEWECTNCGTIILSEKGSPKPPDDYTPPPDSIAVA